MVTNEYRYVLHYSIYIHWWYVEFLEDFFFVNWSYELFINNSFDEEKYIIFSRDWSGEKVYVHMLLSVVRFFFEIHIYILFLKDTFFFMLHAK